MYRFYNPFSTFIKAIVRFCIIGFRPLLGPAVCRYPVGCTTYALETLRTQPIGKALLLIVKRLVSCNPF